MNFQFICFILFFALSAAYVNAAPTKRAARVDPLLTCAESITGTYQEFENTEMQELWKQYEEAQPEKLRNFLMEKYKVLVKYNAERIMQRLPDEVDVNDLYGAGMFGLIDAINNYDLSRGIKFETYASPRIRGAILDHLREMDWVPRLVRHRSSKVEAVKERFLNEHGRQPTNTEIEELLTNSDGTDTENVESATEAAKILKDGASVTTSSSLSKPVAREGSNKARTEALSRIASSELDPLFLVRREQLKAALQKGLDRAERLIVILYYYEGMNMKEIGATIDLSESRVSQMHSSILQRLKSTLGENNEEELRDLAERAR